MTRNGQRQTSKGRRAPLPGESAAHIRVSDHLNPLEYLKAIYDRTKKDSFGYSYLDYAKDLGFSHTNVIRLIIVGQRPLTTKAGERIAEALDLKGKDRRYFLLLVEYAIARLPAERDELFKQLVALKTRATPKELDPLLAEYFSEWYHPVIRELSGLKNFEMDPEWVRSRLMFPLRLDLIKRSLELLSSLKVIVFNKETERWCRSDGRIATDNEVDSLAVIRYHQKMIEIARESITIIPEDMREIRAVTLSLPKESIPILKAKITEWIAEVASMESPDQVADQVVQVNMQMIPFTKLEGAQDGGRKK